MNTRKLYIPLLWSDASNIGNNGDTANRREGSLAPSSALTERQLVDRQLQSGGTLGVRTSAVASQGSPRDSTQEYSAKRDGSCDTKSLDQHKFQGLRDNCHKLSKKGQGLSGKDIGLSKDLASTRGTSKSDPCATHGRGRYGDDNENSGGYGGLPDSWSTEERYDNVSPGSTCARASNGRNPTLDDDFGSVDSWEFVGDENSVKDGNSDAMRSFGSSRPNKSVKESSQDRVIAKSDGGVPRCGTARRETNDFGTTEGGNKSSIDEHRSGEASGGGSNNSCSSKNILNEAKLRMSREKRCGKTDAEGERKRSLARSPKRGTDSESSDGSSSCVGSESGDDSETSDSSHESDGRKHSDALNGEDKGSKTAGYDPSKYSRKPSSKYVVEGVQSQNLLSHDGGAISKYNYSFSDKKHSYRESDRRTDDKYKDEDNHRSNTARDEVVLTKEVTRLPSGEVSCVWQFQNEHGSWITYGQSNSEGAYPTSSRVNSDDIENYFLTDPEKIPLLITTDYNSYVLNFQTMTQTNEKTKVQRVIRRVPKQDVVDTKPPEQHGSPPLSSYAVEKRKAKVHLNTAAGAVDRHYNQGDCIPTRETISVAHEWQFEDEHGYWITFGQPSSAFGIESFSTPSTDDIEEFFSTRSKQLMPIQTPHNDYLLNFATMTQINEKTKFERRIRRVPKLNSSKKGFLKGVLNSVADYLFGEKSSTSNSENNCMEYTGVHQNAITYPNPIAVSSSSTGEYLTDCTTATVDQVHRSAASGEYRDLANWADNNTERYQSSFASSGSNNNTVAGGPSHLNRAIHDTERPHSTEAASIGPEHFRAGAQAPVRTNYGAASPTSFPGNSLAHFPSTSTPHDMAEVRYVWQFQDEQGAWITYGQPNSIGNWICTTSATSDDIERHCSIHQARVPMIIQSSYNRYVLDFQTMTQTNERTLVQRPFRRVPIHLSHE